MSKKPEEFSLFEKPRKNKGSLKLPLNDWRMKFKKKLVPRIQLEDDIKEAEEIDKSITIKSNSDNSKGLF